MRPTNNVRRSRGRPNRKQHGSPRHQTFDSHGPEVRIRGNAPQVYEKYLSLARDASSSGDRILAEGFFQYAEHYFRIMNDSTDPRRPSPPNQVEGSGGQESQGESDSTSGETPRRGGQSNDGPAARESAPVEMEQPFIDPAESEGYWPAPGEGGAQANPEREGETRKGDGEGQDTPPRRASRGRPRGRRRQTNGAADADADSSGAATKDAAKKDRESAAADDSDSDVVTS